MMKWAILLSLLALCTYSSSWTLVPAVNTSSGRIHGFIDSRYSEVSQLMNIPFAQPPIGKLRFAPPAPLPANATDTDIDATKFRPVSFQYNPTAAQAVLFSVCNENYLPKAAVVNASNEDCLSLAIWTPAIAVNITPSKPAAMPVLIWFFGGGFTKGCINTAYYKPVTVRV